MPAAFDRESLSSVLWWARSHQPALGLLYASAKLRRGLLGDRQQIAMVVGSYGKTTTTRATRAVLGLPSNPWSETNPNTLGEVAWSILREGAWRGHAVAEVGIAAPGQMARYAKILRPHTTIVTWIGHEHVRAFGDVLALRDQKADAVRCLPKTGTAILNADDAQVRWMASQTGAHVMWYGTSPDCDVWADDIQLEWPTGMRFVLRTRERASVVQTRLLGRRSVHNLLAAAAAGLNAGIPWESIVSRLEALPPTRSRLQPIRLTSGAIMIRDEYKATPETVGEAIRLLTDVPAQRRVVVCGDLNNLPSVPVEPHYERIGSSIAAVADLVLVVGTALSKYLPGLRAGGMSDHRILEAEGVHEAIALLRGELRVGDVVLLKGFEDERLSRIALALSGTNVQCRRSSCTAYLQFCDDCPLLSKAA